MNTHKQFEKKLRSVVRELDDLGHRIYRPKSEKLPEPIPRGWKRFYVLTEKAEARPDRHILQAILPEISTVVLHWRKNFLRGRRAGRKMIEIKQKLKDIPEQDWFKKRYPGEWKRYFRRIYKPQYHRNCWEYEFSLPWLFKLKVERHWMTHVWIIDSEAIRRRAELQRWMEFHQGHHRYARLKGRSNWWRHSEVNIFERESLRDTRLQILDAKMEGPKDEMSPRFGRVHFIPWNFLTPRGPTSRGAPLRTERLQVRILPWGPFTKRGLSANTTAGGQEAVKEVGQSAAGRAFWLFARSETGAYMKYIRDERATRRKAKRISARRVEPEIAPFRCCPDSLDRGSSRLEMKRFPVQRRAVLLLSRPLEPRAFAGGNPAASITLAA